MSNQEQSETALEGVGPQLRNAREQAGLSLDYVAEETRISVRNLENIEGGLFSELPGKTYAIGFSKSFAKVVGLDQNDVAEMVRAEMGVVAPQHEISQASFEPGDPARVPSSRLGWFSAIAAILLLVGLFFTARILFFPAAELPSLIAQENEEARQAELVASESDTEAEEAAPTTGQVVFTSLEEGIWVKFYDGTGNQLMQKLMAKGEVYSVPAGVEGPQIWTGRPDALSITIGGRAVPKLAEEDQVMRDIPITAEALLSRGQDVTPEVSGAISEAPSAPVEALGIAPAL